MSVETTDYPIVTPDTLATQVALNARSGRAVWIHGPAGGGKSECVVELGSHELVKTVAWSRFYKANGQSLPSALEDLEVIHLTIPQMEAEDFVGVPFHKRVDGKDMDQERTTSWAPAEFLRRNKPVILFLDEASAAETRVQKVLLQIVQERKVFNISLPEGTIIILAGNRSTDRAAVKMVPFPLGNRCAHYTFLNSAKAWGAWGLRKGVPAIFVAWVNQNPAENLHGYSQADTSLAQLTPRSLYYAAMDYLEAKEMGLGFSEIEIAIAANIGYTASLRLNAWLRLKDELPTVDEIKSKPESARLPERGRVDRSYFLASMLMDALRQPETTTEEMINICTYMDRIASNLPEVTDALAWVGQSLSQMAKEKLLPMAKMAAVMKALVGRKALAATLMDFFKTVNTVTGAPVAKAS